MFKNAMKISRDFDINSKAFESKRLNGGMYWKYFTSKVENGKITFSMNFFLKVNFLIIYKDLLL